VLALAADVKTVLAVFFAFVAAMFIFVPFAIGIMRIGFDEATRKPVFQGPYAEGRETMTVLEAAKFPAS
jgi:hypothetical protein